MKRSLVPFLIALALPLSLGAQESQNGLTIEQISPNDMIGEYTLIKPGNARVVLKKDKHTFTNLAPGAYTLLVTPPSGSITKILQFFDDDLVDTKNHPQISFSIEDGIHMNLRLEYTFTRVGIVSVSSEPPGLEFTMVGPNDFTTSGVTPMSFDKMPEGQYSATFTTFTGCATPPPLSDRLVKDSRINFTINISCEGMENMQQKVEQNLTFEFVNTVINNTTVIFRDTPISQWYAPYVHTALRIGVMSGYKNDKGELTGEFGPGNNVTLAELLKIAHELADINEFSAGGRSRNASARGTWYEKYLTSAEQLHWLVYTDGRLDLGRNATRAEVVVTLLQALDVPRLWATGNLFTDIDRSTLYASSIETAAIDGLVDGYDDGTFRPNASINRAEIAKVISQAIELYLDK